MAFGAPASKLSHQTNNNVQVAEMINNKGDIIDMTSYGGKQETQEEYYSATFTNAAVNGQTGSSIVSTHNLNQVATDYAKENKTTVVALSTAA